MAPAALPAQLAALAGLGPAVQVQQAQAASAAPEVTAAMDGPQPQRVLMVELAATAAQAVAQPLVHLAPAVLAVLAVLVPTE